MFCVGGAIRGPYEIRQHPSMQELEIQIVMIQSRNKCKDVSEAMRSSFRSEFSYCFLQADWLPYSAAYTKNDVGSVPSIGTNADARGCAYLAAAQRDRMQSEFYAESW
jgi:hypothetical protein